MLISSTTDDELEAYFRGRKLHGKAVKLPENYVGAILEQSDETLDDQNGQDVPELIGTLQVKGEFEEIVVWGHESTGDATNNPFVRGLEEWISVSEKIHGPCQNKKQG